MNNLTFEQLPKAIEELALNIKKIEQFLLNGKNNETEIDTLLTIKEAAKFLDLSVPTLYRKVSKTLIPFCKKSNRLYFSKADLINWVKSSRVQLPQTPFNN
jgi:excisionase family DNA binding protein